MTSSPCTRSQTPASARRSPTAPVRRLVPLRLALSLALVVPVVLVGCASDDRLAREIHEIGCISHCQETKDRCDADARFDYAQCQAGYSQSYTNYRYCLASSTKECGYPWWSCSENRYGYCTNRYWECYHACRGTPRSAQP